MRTSLNITSRDNVYDVTLHYLWMKGEQEFGCEYSYSEEDCFRLVSIIWILFTECISIIINLNSYL